MNSKDHTDLTFFVCRFLQDRGGVVEESANGFDVLLTEGTAQELEIAEHTFLNKDVSAPNSFAYGSALLDKMVNASCATIPVINCALHLDYLKSQGFDSLVAKQFSFTNSIGEISSFEESPIDYILVTVSYLAQSDEQKLGLLPLAFNLDSGACVEKMTDLLDRFETEPISKEEVPFGDRSTVTNLVEWIESEIHDQLALVLEDFWDSMNRRYRRDSANLAEYYQSLEKEMRSSLERSSLSEDLVRDRLEKIALLPGELKRKDSDLYKKYSVTITIKPAAVMLLRAPGVKITYLARIGKRKKTLTLYYNPVTKKLDPFRCQGCGRTMTTITFCDNLHQLCPNCSNSCPACK